MRIHALSAELSGRGFHVRPLYCPWYQPSQFERMIRSLYLYEGSALDYARAYLEDTGLLSDVPENLRTYFDTHAFARDMVLPVGVYEIEIDGRRFIAEAW